MYLLHSLKSSQSVTPPVWSRCVSSQVSVTEPPEKPHPESPEVTKQLTLLEWFIHATQISYFVLFLVKSKIWTKPTNSWVLKHILHSKNSLVMLPRFFDSRVIEIMVCRLVCRTVCCELVILTSCETQAIRSVTLLACPGSLPCNYLVQRAYFSLVGGKNPLSECILKRITAQTLLLRGLVLQ